VNNRVRHRAGNGRDKRHYDAAKAQRTAATSPPRSIPTVGKAGRPPANRSRSFQFGAGALYSPCRPHRRLWR